MHLIHFVFLITVAQYVGDTEGCSNTLPHLYSPVGADVSFTFKYTILSGIAFAKVENQAGTDLVSASYVGGNVTAEPFTSPRVDFTGDATTGDWSFTLNNIQTSDIGLYTLSRQDITQSCVTLYVTGKPTKPVISPTSVSVNVGDTATFTCITSSTTVPTGSGLTMFYSWRHNGADVTAGGRYTMSGQTLSVTNVIKGDSSDTFTCTAREDKGLTFDESDSARIDVTYGPDDVTLQPTTTDYSHEEGDSTNTITCSADCNPPCTFQWKQSSTSVSSGGVLILGAADKSDAGTYTCTASRGASSSRDSPSVTVRVNYGPGASIVMNPSATVQTFNESQGSIPTIQCSADCSPGCTYSWSGDRTGPVTSVNGALSLGVVNRIKADRYTCTATRTGNTARTSTISVTIFVRYGPGVVALQPTTTNYSYEEGVSINTITCSADCNPPCTYQWNRQSSPSLSSGGVLSLGSADKSDVGTYTCTASRGTSSSRGSPSVTVSVNYGPGTSIVMTPSATVQTFNENQDPIPTIQCSTECNPACTYSWSGDKTGPVTSVNGALSLGVVNRIKADKYTCTATGTGNPARTATISVTIVVRYGPTAIQLNSSSVEVTVIEGSTTQDISCSSDCYPGCDCTWSQFNNNGVFRLGTVYRNIAGNYTCTCINSYTQTGWRLDKRVTVIVQYFPDLHISTNKVVTEHDTNIQLSCTADGVPAQYTSGGWTHFLPDNQTAQHDLSIMININDNVVSLTLPTVTYMDTGKYRCMVSNGITDYRTGEVTAMAETIFLVKGSPVITQQEENTAGKTNSNVTLSAKVFSQSDIVVQWYKEHNGSWSLVSDGRFHSDVTVSEVSPLYYGVPVKQSGFMASLHIENVQSSDFAEYRLVVRNTIGNTSNTTTFRSNGPPDPPKDFSVITGSETAKNVSFKWMSGFHGGADQHFVIEYSQAGNIWTIGVTVAGGFDENKLFQGTVSGLDPDTTYNFRLHAGSDNGVSPDYLNTTATTKAVPAGPGPTGNLIGPIAGGLGGAVVISILVIVIVVFVRRYKGKSDTGNDRKALDNSEEDIVINDMYGSHQMHSNVQSSASSSGNASQLYAEVVKPKKKPVNEDDNLYAMVDKSKKQNPKPKDKATPKKGKGAAPETVYENPETLQGKNAGNADLVYENHKPPAPPSRGKNENSLHYADLEFVKNKKGGKKLVIHGLENSTDYAEVVIGKRGTPLPDSDDETPSAKQE